MVSVELGTREQAMDGPAKLRWRAEAVILDAPPSFPHPLPARWPRARQETETQMSQTGAYP